MLAAVLPQALVVTREPLAEIRLRSVVLGDRTTPVRSTDRLTEPTDVLFIATKATGLPQAVERIATEPGVVVPLPTASSTWHSCANASKTSSQPRSAWNRRAWPPA